MGYSYGGHFNSFNYGVRIIMKDTYNTINKPSDPVLYKDKNSKFYGYAFPLSHEDDLNQILEQLKSDHKSAGHFCYAYQMGTDSLKYRVNDDGEPSNSAGMPIYGQIQSFDVTNIVVIVIRIFGGTKLGVGGLISAYKTAAKLALENSKIISKTIDKKFLLEFDYKYMSKVMRLIHQLNAKIHEQQMEMTCSFEVAVRQRDAQKFKKTFETYFGVTVKEV